MILAVALLVAASLPAGVAPAAEGGRSGGGHFGGGWWVVDDGWYFYPSPIYPYPDPYVPPTAVAPSAGYWYYCPSAGAYYPYVTDCPEAWQPVVPQAPVS